MDKVPYFASNLTGLTGAWYGYCDRGPDGKWRLKPAAANHEPERFDREWEWYCHTVSWNGTSGVRMMPYSHWDVDTPQNMLTPYILTDNGWDLTQWNENYFAILRQIAEIANKYGLTFSFCLFDGCQFVGERAEFNPWRDNPQGYGHFFQSIPLSLAWIDRALDTLAGLNYTVRLGNELEVGAYGLSSNSTCEPFLWAEAVLGHLHNVRGIPWSNIYSGFCMSDIDGLGWGGFLKANIEDWFGEEAKSMIPREVHGAGSWSTLENPEGRVVKNLVYGLGYHLSYDGGPHMIRVSISADGSKYADRYFDGGSLCDRYMEGNAESVGVSPGTWRAMIRKLLADVLEPGGSAFTVAGAHKWELEYFPQRAWDNEACMTESLSGMAEEVKTKTGLYPENYHKYPKPEPTSQPIPVNPPFDWWGWIANRKWYLLGAIVIIVALFMWWC